MRYLLVATLALALFAAGYLAAQVGQTDADAQGTWQYERLATHPEFESFIETLPGNCAVDWEVYSLLGTNFAVAYSCPD